jgi:hypothetical protein
MVCIFAGSSTCQGKKNIWCPKSEHPDYSECNNNLVPVQGDHDAPKDLIVPCTIRYCRLE